MKRVTGIGGLFFKSKDPKKITEWYQQHLGIPVVGGTMAIFEWREKDDPENISQTVWSAFADTTEYFGQNNKQFMFNYKVDNLELLMEELKKEGVETVGEIEASEYGKFAWILDPEGNKIELWEPAP